MIMITCCRQQPAQRFDAVILRHCQRLQHMADLGHQLNGEAVGFGACRISTLIGQVHQCRQGSSPAVNGFDFDLLPLGQKAGKLFLNGQQHGDTCLLPADQATCLKVVHTVMFPILQKQIVEIQTGDLLRHPPGILWDGLNSSRLKRPVKNRRRVILHLFPDQSQSLRQAGVPLVAPIDHLSRIPAVHHRTQTQDLLPGLNCGQHHSQGMALHLPDQLPQIRQLRTVHIAVDTGEELHAVQFPEVLLCHRHGTRCTAVQLRQLHALAQYTGQLILRGEQKRQSPFAQALEPTHQLLPVFPGGPPPGIFKIVKVHAVTLLRNVPDQEFSRCCRLMGRNLHVQRSDNCSIELLQRLYVGAVHHRHRKIRVPDRQPPQDLPADLGLADACHTGDPPGFGILTGEMGAKLLHYLITAHQGINRHIHRCSLPEPAVSCKLGEEGSQSLVVLTGRIPDGVDPHFQKLPIPLFKFLLVRHFQQRIIVPIPNAGTQNCAGPILMQAASKEQQGAIFHLSCKESRKRLCEIRSKGIAAIVFVISRLGKHHLLVMFDVAMKLDQQVSAVPSGPLNQISLEDIAGIDSDWIMIEVFETFVEVRGQNQPGENLGQKQLIPGPFAKLFADLPGIKIGLQNDLPFIRTAGGLQNLSSFIITPVLQMRLNRRFHSQLCCIAAQQCSPARITHPH